MYFSPFQKHQEDGVPYFLVDTRWYPCKDQADAIAIMCKRMEKNRVDPSTNGIILRTGRGDEKITMEVIRKALMAKKK